MSYSWMCCYRMEGIKMSYMYADMVLRITSYSALGPNWLAQPLKVPMYLDGDHIGRELGTRLSPFTFQINLLTSSSL